MGLENMIKVDSLTQRQSCLQGENSWQQMHTTESSRRQV